MSRAAPLQGELQSQVMAALWRIDRGTVEEVRSALPPRHRGAYTTIQTVLNRLSDRGLVVRKRRGNVILYRPRISEAQYLSQTIEQALAAASVDARQVALALLLGGIESDDREALEALAREVARRRGAS